MTKREAAIRAFKRLDPNNEISESRWAALFSESDISNPECLQYLSETITSGLEKEVEDEFYNFCLAVFAGDPKVDQLIKESGNANKRQSVNQ